MSIEYFGEKLKAMRKNKGWTQAQLAKKMKLVTGTISAYETGLKYPSLERLVAICQIFDTSADYLLGLSDRQMPLKMGALTDAQMQPFLQIIAEVTQYNTLREKSQTKDE
ncbi:MAG: helix-turn-helix domain-containing protein [Streptococcaceae bacterium]|jgi:transcriptional regulator with XRE-family HTH domain|nr:helix-turn-helix domain-containing protein [Streptococcaceae bacterium]